jgi:hypothetical protein
MNKRLHILPILLTGCGLLLSLLVQAQAFQQFDYLPVKSGGKTLRYPWTGGVNNVQFGKADINNDGRKDLVVYDKTNRRYLTFLTLSNNSTQFRYVRGYDKYFPTLSNWMVMKDYNGDGIEDIFTYNDAGNIKVFKGYYEKDTLRYKLQQNGFFYQGSGILINVYCSSVQRPAFADINQDGDIDILTYGVLGNRLLYYENQQRELGLPADSLFYKKADNCWGNVLDAFTATYVLRDTCNFKFARLAQPQEIMHEGSIVEAFDIDNNGALDALVGSVSLNSTTMLYNFGSKDNASVLQQDTHYPSTNVSFDASSFGVPVFLDADNDGKTDLLISTYDLGSANVNNIWWYKNTSSDVPEMVLQQKNFLLDEMIDVGENAVPCFADINNDSLPDLLIGNGGYKNNVQAPVYQLTYYKNTGTKEQPAYTLEDADFLDISELNVADLSPACGDLDNDGDVDLLLGISDGRILHWENTANPGNAATFTYRGLLATSDAQTISVGNNATPFIVDLNRDGFADLVVGERSGNLNYYTGTQSGSVRLQYQTDSLGKVHIRYTSFNPGLTQPCIADFNQDGKYDLVLGTFLSELLWYDNIEDKLSGTFTTTTPLINTYTGFRTAPALADLTGDGQWEMAVGIINGGLLLYSQNPPPAPDDTAIITPEESVFILYPNPGKGQINIVMADANSGSEIVIFNALGAQVFSGNYTPQTTVNFRVTGLAAGVYVVRIKNGKHTGYKKLVVQ